MAPGVTPQVEVSAARREGFIRLSVKDNGIGIPLEHQPSIFKMFHRAQIAYPGTGIGLAVVHKATERLGGKLGVESEPDKGSTFWIELRSADSQ